MATITNLTSGIEINYGGAVTYIKHGNVKLLKRGTNLNIYDDSDDDGNQRGQVYISIPFSEVTSPVEADIDALYATVRGYIDVSSGGGGATQLNDLTDVTTGLPGTPTEADSGKILYYDFDAGVWQTDDAITAGTNVINGKKASAGTITKGKPVYLVGFDSDLHTVEEANAGSSSTMPVIGFAAEDMDNTNSKHIITFGKLTGVNTSIYSVGDILYMDTSTGALTTTRPTGESSLIQRIAKVLKVDPSGGQLFVFNTARTAGLPNLGTDKLWIGDANGIPVEVDKSALTSTSIKGNLRVPTETEWENERLSWSSNNSAGAFASPLRLSMAGVRSLSSGSLNDVGTFGFYWSSTVSGTTASRLRFSSSDASMGTRNRAHGRSVRLIVDGTFTQAEFNENYLGKTIVYLGLTYGFVYNSSTQKIWLDRNLGATQVATSSTDSNAYGDLYQWGRFGDGHQSRTSPTHNGDTLGKPSTSTASGAWDGKFITTSTSPYDWLSAQDNTLWQSNLITNSITLNKTFTLESPTASDNITIFRTDVDITVQEVILVSTGTSPSTNYVLKFSSNRSAVGTNLTLNGTTTSTSTGDVATLSTATIPANSWIWLETTAASGTNVYLTIDIRFSEV